MSRRCRIILLLLCLCGTAPAMAQQQRILVGGVVEGRDTIPMIFLPDFEFIQKVTPAERRTLARRRKDEERRMAEYERLRYNIFVVYPYAVIAADVLKDVDTRLAAISDRSERKHYLKSVERDLNARFKGKLEDLTITQGQLLVKLIDRQTGKNCFSIIRELKGGFSAVIWQSVALLFSNNLKREYDPTDRDREIEQVVKSIEEYYRSVQPASASPAASAKK